MQTNEEKQDGVTQAEQQQMANLLNESQRRSLTTVLRRTELAVWRLENRLTRLESAQLTLTRFTNPPDADQRAALLQLTQHLRREIARLASDYGLEVAEDNFLRGIQSEFSLLWCDLEDTRPKKLRSYGAMNPRAYDVLGPQIQRLIELVLTIDGIASGKIDPLLMQQASGEST